MNEQIKIELCGGKMPEKAHATDAAFDVFTREDVELVPYLRTAIPLGFKIQLPPHLAAVIQPRSGMSLKGMACKVRTENGSIDARIDADVLVGLVDCGYTGEVCALLRVGCGSTPELCGRGNHGFYSCWHEDSSNAHCSSSQRDVRNRYNRQRHRTRRTRI